jgi:hypothetical protein
MGDLNGRGSECASSMRKYARWASPLGSMVRAAVGLEMLIVEWGRRLGTAIVEAA